MKEKQPTEKQANKLWHHFHESDEKNFWEKYQVLLKQAARQHLKNKQVPVYIPEPPSSPALSPTPASSQASSVVFFSIIALAVAVFFFASRPPKKETQKQKIVVQTETKINEENLRLRRISSYRKQGKAIAQTSLNLLYDLDSVQNIIATFYWYQHQARQGHALAQYELGKIYDFGFMKDDQASFYWQLKSAKQGVAKAQYQAGLFYYLGDSILRNKTLSSYWFAKSKEQGNAKGGAMLSITRYLRKDSISKNNSIYWLHEAARLGDTYAQAELARLLWWGEGVKKNQKQAMQWIPKTKIQDTISVLGIEW